MGYNRNMTAFTLTLPDDLVQRLAALPPDEVNTTAALALADLVSSSEAGQIAETGDDTGDDVVSAEEAAYLAPGIRRGLQAAAEGRVRSAEAVFADFEARYGRSSSNGTASS